MTGNSWHIAILIPARNEEVLLSRCLKSVLGACSALPPAVTVDVVVAIDNSIDRSLQIARKILRSRLGAVVSTEVGAVGPARAVAAETALRRYRGPLDRCWLANTDADCSVPATWMIDQLSLAAKGIEAIAGTVDVDSFAEHSVGVEERFRSTYLIHADGSHPHIHGANLGVRADAYVRAGGWGQLDTAEDHDLWRRLLQTGTRQRSVASIRVSTSGRRVGRAPLGFADALAAHNPATA